MSNTKHTLGPWEWDGNWLRGDGKLILWYTTDDNGTHAKFEDARLIAAAPDLLEALQRYISHCDGKAEEMARAAIAKATGE